MHKFLAHWQKIVLLVAILVGMGIQLIGYDFAFPYVQEFDEGRLFWNAYALRIGAEELADLSYYPPALYWLHNLVQPQIEAQTNRPAEFDAWRTIGTLRLMAIAVNGLTALLIALSLRRFLGWGAGVLGAFAFLIMPMILEQSTLALTEPWQAFGYTLAMYAAIRAYQEKRPLWALLSIVAGLQAIVFKYSAIPALGFGMAVLVVQLWQQRNRAWVMSFLLAWGLILGTAVFLVVGFDALKIVSPTFQEGNQFLYGELINQEALGLVLTTASQQVFIPLLVILLLSIVSMGVILWQRRWRFALWMLILDAVLVGALIFVSRFMVFPEGVSRYVTPSSPLMIALIIFNVVTVLSAFQRYWKNIWVYRGVMVVLGLLWLVPAFGQTWELVQTRRLPYTTGQLSAWAYTMIHDDGQILINRFIYHARMGQRIFERDRGGWQGDWKFVRGVTFSDAPIEDWMAQGFYYYMSNSDASEEEPSLLLLRQFLPEAGVRSGEPLYFYRLWRMQVERDDVFDNGIAFAGYDLNTDDARQGGAIYFIPYWRANSTPQGNYNVYLHLAPLDSRDIVAQADGTPVRLERPTVTWDDSSETLVGATFTIPLPDDLPAGEYRLLMGLYNYETGVRLLSPTGEDFIVVDVIEIAD